MIQKMFQLPFNHAISFPISSYSFITFVFLLACQLTSYPFFEIIIYYQPFWYQMCGFLTSRNSPVLCRHQVGILQFNSIMMLTTWSWHRHHRLRKGSVPQLLSLQVPSSNPRLSPVLVTNQLYIGVFHNPLTGLMICYNSSQNPGIHFIYIHQFIIKDTNEQPDEGAHKARSRRARSIRTSSILVKFRCSTLSVCGGVHQFRSSLN